MNHVIGVAAVLFAGTEVLLQDRAKDPGRGLYVLPGGRLDEADPACGVRRELKEELGLDIPLYHEMRPVHHAMDKLLDGKPVLMLYFAADISHLRGSEVNMEPHKCDGLMWRSAYSLPPNMWDNDRAAVHAAINAGLLGKSHGFSS
jgi:8-oxo-dGTP pyrophosphatase MutT (NUDIX family)